MKRDAVLSVVLGLACLAAWEVAVRVGHTSPLVLPAPSVVAQSLWQGLNSGYLWPHIAHTLTEVVLGLLLGASMGFAGGMYVFPGGKVDDGDLAIARNPKWTRGFEGLSDADAAGRAGR